MSKELQQIYENLNAPDIEQFVVGIDESVKIVDDLSIKLLKLLERNEIDHFIVTERISQLFIKYLDALIDNLNSSNDNLSFWSASLIAHYGIENKQALQILFDAIEHADMDKASVAIVISLRKRYKEAVPAIKNRLQAQNNLTPKQIEFLKVNLDEFNKRDIR